MTLQHLPLNVDCNAFTSGKGESTQVRLPDYYPVGGLSKADVHSDMGIIVVALNWPRCAACCSQQLCGPCKCVSGMCRLHAHRQACTSLADVTFGTYFFSYQR